MFRKIIFNKTFNVNCYHTISNKENVIQKKWLNLSYFKNYKSGTKSILFYSSTTGNNNEILVNNLSDVLPEIPTPSPSSFSELGSSLAEISTTVITDPTLSSLGLGGLSGSGLVQTSLDFLHLNLHLPWWQAIVAGTIIIRLALFPLIIIAQKNAIAVQNHMPTIQRMQLNMINARKSGNIGDAIDSSRKLSSYMKINKINPLKNFLVPMAQMPIFISVFTGIRGMANLPVESLKTGGTLWFTDLAVPDPYYLLPLLTVTTMAATIELGSEGVKAQNMDKNVKFFIRMMPVLSLPFLCYFQSAMLCYWFTSNVISLLTSLFLKIPRVRIFFNIPLLINHDTAHPMKQHHSNSPKLGFMESIRESYKNLDLVEKIAEREKYDALKLKEVKNDKKSKLTN